jgi:diguanylate cyclase (GGDEF)-like protein
MGFYMDNKNRGFDTRTNTISTVMQKSMITYTNKISTKLIDVQLSDIFSADSHSDDFHDTRAQFVLERLKLMAYIFAFLVPASYIVDYILLDDPQRSYLLYARITLALSLIILANCCRNQGAKNTLQYLLPASFILPICFYVVTQLILAQTADHIEIVGYSYMPYLVVTMLALFPLTISHSLFIIVVIFIPMILVEFYLHDIFSFTTLNKVWAFSMFAGVTLWLQTGQLVMLMKLYRESTLDPLTGLINRRVLMMRLNKEITNGNNFFVLIFDLDKFKKINDSYGHLSGDLVLKTIANIIKAEIDEKDIIARFGGEEFVAVLSAINNQQALAIAEKIRINCENKEISTKNGDIIKVTTSIGMTNHQAEETIEMTLNRADELLYQAKSEGRNKVVFA